MGRGYVTCHDCKTQFPGGEDLQKHRKDGCAGKEDRKTTQLFELNNILIAHCGESLTADRIESILREMEKAITVGPCSWAFKA